ncbi:hypothetical protein Gogos_012830, partial [Gossypium gossypioides]|nr:hypothetical protein [Gossypium gossypioides]
VLWSKYGVTNGFSEDLSRGRCSFLWITISKHYEDVLHVLRDCLAARTIWDKLILQQSLSRRFERVLIQTDSIKVVNAIKDAYSRNFNSSLVRRIHHILEVVKQWKIQHIPREENSIADSLVKTLHNKRLGLRLFEDPPLRI